MYWACPMSEHGYACMFKVEAILEFLQSSHAFVVKEYLASKAKPCCFENFLVYVPRSNRVCSYQQEEVSVSVIWTLKAALDNPFSGPDETALSTSRM